MRFENGLFAIYYGVRTVWYCHLGQDLGAHRIIPAPIPKLVVPEMTGLFSGLPKQLYLALGEGDGNAVFLENIPKRQKHIAADIGQPACRIGDPETQDIIHRTVAEPDDMTNRRAHGQHTVN